MRLPSVLTTNNNYQNSYGSQDIYQYSFRCGSKIIPPNRIKCPPTQNNSPPTQFIMSQKSSKGLSTLSKHMTKDTKLQLDQNTVTTTLIIPILTTANPNPKNGEMYVNSNTNHLFICKNNA